MRTAVATSRWRHLLAVAAVLALVGAACGDDSGGGGAATTAGGGSTATTQAPDEGTPQPGGKLIYAQEAEDGGGLCLPEAQLDISGINYARAIYDTLTQPNDKGEFVPYLAKSVTPNATYDTWTIVLRDGVTFHDGTALDATVVKNNLDAYRGQYAGRSPLLFTFVFSNVDTVTAVDPMTVEIHTKTPWPALPAFLFGSGRVGIMAQAQLDSADCAKDLIGTGPFKLKDWVIGDHFSTVKNPDYWAKDADGNPLPYLDELEFRPIVDGQQAVNAVASGQVQAMHTSSAIQIEQLRQLRDQDKIGLVESDKFGEINHYMLNVSKPPFDNMHARLAFAYGLDIKTLNDVRAKGILNLANGPFAPGSVGYLDDSGYPKYDLDKAKAEVQAYKDETGQDLEFTLGGTAGDPEGVQTQQFVQSMLQQTGMKVSINQIEQAQYISTAIGGDYQAFGWRNFPGSDPDTQYVWWYDGSKNPVNFGRFNDPEINRLLDAGRTTIDPAARKGIYEDLNREFGKQAWNIWTSYTLWDVATSTKVHGIMGPDLPDNGGGPFPGLATGHPFTGIWIEP